MAEDGAGPFGLELRGREVEQGTVRAGTGVETRRGELGDATWRHPDPAPSSAAAAAAATAAALEPAPAEGLGTQGAGSMTPQAQGGRWRCGNIPHGVHVVPTPSAGGRTADVRVSDAVQPCAHPPFDATGPAQADGRAEKRWLASNQPVTGPEQGVAPREKRVRRVQREGMEAGASAAVAAAAEAAKAAGPAVEEPRGLHRVVEQEGVAGPSNASPAASWVSLGDQVWSKGVTEGMERLLLASSTRDHTAAQHHPLPAASDSFFSQGAHFLLPEPPGREGGRAPVHLRSLEALHSALNPPPRDFAPEAYQATVGGAGASHDPGGTSQLERLEQEILLTALRGFGAEDGILPERGLPSHLAAVAAHPEGYVEVQGSVELQALQRGQKRVNLGHSQSAQTDTVWWGSESRGAASVPQEVGDELGFQTEAAPLDGPARSTRQGGAEPQDKELGFLLADPGPRSLEGRLGHAAGLVESSEEEEAESAKNASANKAILSEFWSAASPELNYPQHRAPLAAGDSLSGQSLVPAERWRRKDHEVPHLGVSGYPLRWEDRSASLVRERLVRLALAVEERDMMEIQNLYRQLQPCAKARGTALERVLHYTLHSLMLRLTGTAQSFLCAPPKRPLAELNKARMWYYTSCPLIPFCGIALTGMIFSRVVGQRRVHIVDMGQGMIPQWSPFMKLLAQQPGAPLQHLRITWVDSTYLVNPGRDDLNAISAAARVGWTLSEAAKAAGIDFSFEHVAISEESLHLLYEVRRRPSDALVVCTSFDLMFYPSQGPTGLRIQVLKWMIHLRPSMTAVVELDMDASTRAFLHRVKACFDYHIATFESHEAGATPADRRLLYVFEEIYFSRIIARVVSCKGRARAVQPDSLRRWQQQFRQAGFHPEHLSSTMLDAAYEVLKFYPPGFGLLFDKGALCLTWRGTSLASASSWIV